MSLFTGKLRGAGLAKESVLGTLVTPPTEFIRFVPPDGFYPKIAPILAKGVGVLPDAYIKQSGGPGELTGMKLKIEAEGENIGNHLTALFGLDTVAEIATYIVGASNNKIDFKENGGAQVTATLASATYAIGTSSAQAGTLCAQIKTQMQAAGTGTYTVTYVYATRKMTIAVSGAVANVQILWSSGTNNANAAFAVCGFTKADTANAASVTSNSTNTQAVFTHTYSRQAVAQLPTYSWWFDKGNLFPQFVGCMLNKADFLLKAKEIVYMDVDWTGLNYDTTGISQSAVYSAVRPWTFSMAVVNIDGSPVTNFRDIKISVDNTVKADHALNSSIYPARIYTEQFKVEMSGSVFFEDAVQYNKFLNGTLAHIQVVITSSDDVANAATGNKYVLTLDIPTLRYKAAALPINNSVIEVAFAGDAIYDPVTAKSLNAILQNSVATAY